MIQQPELILGEPAHCGTTVSHLSYHEILSQKRADGTIKDTDPRLMISKRDVADIAIFGYDFAVREGKMSDHKNTTFGGVSTQRDSLMRVRIASVSGDMFGEDGKGYGKSGVLASNMERAGLEIYAKAETQNDPHAKKIALRALTIAAAAHDIGAHEAMYQDHIASKSPQVATHVAAQKSSVAKRAQQDIR